MSDYQDSMDRAPSIIKAATECSIPIAFFKEAHRREFIDFGRKLDGAERRSGGHTDVCVHHSFVDGHQHDYICPVVENCFAGSSQTAHDAALNAMQYLQSDARCTSERIIKAFQAFTS